MPVLRSSPFVPQSRDYGGQVELRRVFERDEGGDLRPETLDTVLPLRVSVSPATQERVVKCIFLTTEARRGGGEG